MYALFRTGGKQFRAEPGKRLRIPSLPAEEGSPIVFEEVLLASDGGEVRVGAPLVEGAKVTAQVIRHGRDRKIIVFKRKRRKNCRRKRGHRQGFTEVVIESVLFP